MPDECRNVLGRRRSVEMTGRINITMVEGASWLAGKLRDLALGVVPDKGKLDILTERMRGVRDEAKRLYHEALTAELAIFNPAPEVKGSLEVLRERLEKRMAQGESWGGELVGDPKPNKPRREQLTEWLQLCADDVKQLKVDIAAEEALLATCRETTRSRKSAYEIAKADLRKLEKIAPTILARTHALQDAQKARLQAADDAARANTGQAAAVLAQFTQDLANAQAGASAAETIQLEETEGGVDLDAIADEEATLADSDELIAQWTRKDRTTVSA